MRSIKGLKKIACLAVVAVIGMSVLGVGNAQAYKRSLNMNFSMEANMISTRKVEVFGKLFDVCINHSSKTVTVKGYVDDWDEMDRVENYFKTKSPSNYKLICELDFAQ